MNERNAAMVERLSTDFVRHKDHAIVKVSTTNVSNPPTDAELDAAFGSPADLPDGYMRLIDDNGSGSNFWGVATVNGVWCYWALTKAV